MNAKTRPWFFKLHLSTCLALMFMSGLLIWLNTLQREIGDRHFYNPPPLDKPPPGMLYHVEIGVIVYGQGWPFAFNKFYTLTEKEQHDPLDYGALAKNLFIGCGVLILIALILENLIHRRKARLECSSRRDDGL